MFRDGPRPRRLGHAMGWFVCMAVWLAAATGAGTVDELVEDSPVVKREGSSPSPTVEQGVEEVKQERRALDETVWSMEVLAQRYEESFVKLWDDLRAAENKYSVFRDFKFDQLTLPSRSGTESHEMGIGTMLFEGERRTLTMADFDQFLTRIEGMGYVIDHTEWHHGEFGRDADGQARSTVSITMHVQKPSRMQRFIVRGSLRVEWSENQDPNGNTIPARIDVTDLTFTGRNGPPIFREVMVESFPGSGFILTYDLNRDGRSEVIIPQGNYLYWNRPSQVFEKDVFLDYPMGSIKAGVFADFTGDGIADFMGARKGTRGALLLFEGNEQGRFPDYPKTVLGEDAQLNEAIAFATGDIDADGDVDLWVAQYKDPYIGGQMPTPYYDANDGFPGYLLVNQGNGEFIDATEPAGLAGKRHRRSFGSSFADLDEDGDLDLLVVSDFAGIDVHYNDGAGHFSDVTAQVVGEVSNFGMSHTYGDYNLDGKLDFYVIGMSSTTARRLDYMNVGRAEFPEYQQMRRRMGYGNRMYCGADRKGVFEQPAFNDQVARTGWSWGSTSFDFDNDGDLDIYIANGHNSNQSAKDYCTTFWTHDIYAGCSLDDPALGEFFAKNYMAVRKEGVSWNPYETNHLFLNEGGEHFINVAYLLGAGHVYDSRNVISDDFDLDGRPDLLFMGRRWDQKKGNLYFLSNVNPEAKHWVGVRLQEEPGNSPMGATVTVTYPGGTQKARFVTGDSFKSQHALLKHFGLGDHDKIDSIEVRWLGGAVKKLENPEIDRYYTISSTEG